MRIGLAMRGFNRLSLHRDGYHGAVSETDSAFEELLETMKHAAAVVEELELEVEAAYKGDLT